MMTDLYEVAVIVTIPVKRLIRIEADTGLQARQLAANIVCDEAERGEDHEWSIPSRSRHEVDSDQDLLGPSILVNHFNIVNTQVLMTGMCPEKIVDRE